jgi:hypothetical protein
MTRRLFLSGSGGAVLLGASGFSGIRVCEHTVVLNPLSKVCMRVLMVTDPHVVEPWFPLSLWESVVEKANSLSPDLILLGGDYSGYNIPMSTVVDMKDVAKVASRLRSPLGVFSVLGNHDWSGNVALGGSLEDDDLVVVSSFEKEGLRVLRNESVHLTYKGASFWVSGLESDSVSSQYKEGLETPADLNKTLAPTFSNSDPVILLAHEPDVFAQHNTRVDLQISGHMHGGQVNIFGWTPAPLPSEFGNRYLYGHIEEMGKHLIVSGGLGYSRLPVRIGSPPELTLINVMI